MFSNDQLDRLSEILADVAKGLFLSSFGPVFFGQKQSSLVIFSAVILAIVFTSFSLKVLEFKSHEY